MGRGRKGGQGKEGWAGEGRVGRGRKGGQGKEGWAGEGRVGRGKEVGGMVGGEEGWEGK